MNYRIASLLTFFIFLVSSVNAQSLKPGFDAREYSDMLTLADLQYFNKDSAIEHYTYSVPFS